MNLHPDKVEDIYFTGGLTDSDKTEFFVEYKGDDGTWHRYTPDFIIRRKAVALRKWQHLNPERLKYELIFATGESIAHDQASAARHFVEG